MKELTEIFNEAVGLDSQGFAKNKITVWKTEHPEDRGVMKWEKSDSHTTSIIGKSDDGRETTLYLPSQAFFVMVAYSKTESLCFMSLDKEDRINLDRKGYQVMKEKVPYGLVVKTRESIKRFPLGEYESFAVRLYNLEENPNYINEL